MEGTDISFLDKMVLWFTVNREFALWTYCTGSG